MKSAARTWSARDCSENDLDLNAIFTWSQLTSLV